MSKVFEVDLDGTLCITESADYRNATPIKEHIEVINNLYDTGNIILINTARGNTTGKDWNSLTINQLRQWGVKYHKLTVGAKEQYDHIIDDKSINIMADLNYIKTVDKYWGKENWLFENKDFAIKEMIINIGCHIKAHYHEKKRELFYVTKGYGAIVKANKTQLLFKGNFVYIETGVVHRLEAIGNDLHIIEISNGFHEGDSRRVEEDV